MTTGVTSGAGNATLPEHLSSPPVFSGIRVARSSVFCVVFWRSLFVLFLLAIELSVLWFTNCDYPVGILKLKRVIIRILVNIAFRRILCALASSCSIIFYSLPYSYNNSIVFIVLTTLRRWSSLSAAWEPSPVPT